MDADNELNESNFLFQFPGKILVPCFFDAKIDFPLMKDWNTMKIESFQEYLSDYKIREGFDSFNYAKLEEVAQNFDNDWKRREIGGCLEYDYYHKKNLEQFLDVVNQTKKGMKMYLYAVSVDIPEKWNIGNGNSSSEILYPMDETRKQEYAKKQNEMNNQTNLRYFHEVACWKGANQIHKWFVDNCSIHDSNHSFLIVSKKSLKQLLETVIKVLEDSNPPTLAWELLPPEVYLFGGSVELDRNYFKNLEYTRAQIEKILDEADGLGYESFRYVGLHL